MEEIVVKNFPWLFFLVFFSLNAAWAEDRALLVNLADYADEAEDLPRLEQNLTIMQDILTQLNFKQRQIKLLTGNQATSKGLVTAFEEWLIDDIGPDDRVVFYYSGQGYQVGDLNGDEDDGCDEALVAYDLKIITDDELNLLFEQVQAQEILVIIDSNFNDTLKLSFQLEQCAKPVNVSTLSIFGEFAFDIFVAPAGLTMVDWIRSHISQNNSFSSNNIITEVWSEKDFFTFDNFTQANTDISNLESTQNLNDLLNWLVDNRHFKVSIESKTKKYQLGEEINFVITSSEEGYLNIIEVGPSGDITVVFPNKFNNANYVAAEEVIEVPSPRVGGFRFVAIEPLGQSRIIALVTDKPLDLLTEGPGTMQGYFKVMNPESVKPFRNFLTRGLGVFDESVPNDGKQEYGGETNLVLGVVEETIQENGEQNSVTTNINQEHGAADITIEVTE